MHRYPGCGSIAALRAMETERKDALFRDPFAATLAGPEALERVRSRGSRGDNGESRSALFTK